MGSSVKSVLKLLVTGFLAFQVGCTPGNYRVEIQRVVKTVPTRKHVADLSGSPASFADNYVRLSWFVRNGRLGFLAGNNSGQPMAVLVESLACIDAKGRRVEAITPGSPLSAVRSVASGSGDAEVFPLLDLRDRKGILPLITQGSDSERNPVQVLRVLVPIMIAGIYHEYHFALDAEKLQQGN